MLDTLINAARPADSAPGQGRNLELPDPELWPEPVNGAMLLSAIAEAVKDYVVVTLEEANVMRLIALSQVLPYLAAYRTLKPDLDFGFARRPSRPVAYQSLSFCDASHV